MREQDQSMSEIMEVLREYLNCSCQYFEPMADDEAIISAYQEAKERGRREGFVPVLIPEDDILLECLVMNADESGEGMKGFTFDPVKVAQYRERMSACIVEEGQTVLLKLTAYGMEEDVQKEAFIWEDSMGEVKDGGPNNRFAGYWDYRTRETVPMLLAEIPVKNPWEVFAWVPFGGWNECPGTEDLMAISKYWYNLYGAVPAVITHDVLEYQVPEPAADDQVKLLAMEQYAFCPDIIDQSDACTLGMMADMLAQSTSWFFWWD